MVLVVNSSVIIETYEMIGRVGVCRMTSGLSLVDNPSPAPRHGPPDDLTRIAADHYAVTLSQLCGCRSRLRLNPSGTVAGWASGVRRDVAITAMINEKPNDGPLNQSGRRGKAWIRASGYPTPAGPSGPG